MRVLQLIDSLETGGAERVAVNIANALVPNIDASYLCATRKEGLLKNGLNINVNYLFLNKKKTIDYKAIRRLSKFVKTEKIDIIHAHSTSFFLATIVRLLNKNLKIVWHDHYGNSEFLEARAYKLLKKCSSYFSLIFSVNAILATWAKTKLNTEKVLYLQNFAVANKTETLTELKGENGKRIIHLANLREQKDHLNLINAFIKVKEQSPDWTLHCVGKDFKNRYANVIKSKIIAENLKDSVFIYGSLTDVSNVLSQSTIAVLPSKSEGLPIALLEYGLAGLPVVVSNVGNCKEVIANDSLGQLIPSENPSALSQAIINYISDIDAAKETGQTLKKYVNKHFSEAAISKTIIKNYQDIIQ